MSGVFIGFDVSLTCTGVAVVKGDKYETYNIKSPAKLGTGIARLNYLYEEFRGVIAKHGRPTMVCVEDYSFASKGKQFNVGEGGGIFRLAMFHEKCELIAVSPNSLKKFITGKGSGDKDVVMMKLLKNFGVEITQNDQADAYGLAKMAESIYALKNGLDLPDNCGAKYQLEAIAKYSVLIKGLPKRR